MAHELALAADWTVGRLTSGDVTLLWASSRTAPVSCHHDAEGCALVLGDALLPGSAIRESAEQLHHNWMLPDAVPRCHDGYHVAIAVRHGEVAIGGDLLGLVPIVYAECGAVRLVASTARWFHLHPAFSDTLDVEGLLGHLLMGGPWDGRTLRSGVRRLGPGRLLRWSGNGVAHERPHYIMPPAGIDASRSFDSRLEQLDALLHAAVRRHSASHDSLTLLLSGGRDSRLLGGYARRDRALDRAITLGAATDHDATCAASVARALRTPHQVHDVPFVDFPRHADALLNWELLDGGMSTLHTCGAVNLLHSGGGLLSGYLLEIRQIAAVPQTHAGILAWTHSHALAPVQLQALVQPALRPMVADIAASISTALQTVGMECNAAAESNERSWRWILAAYARFHAGMVPWRLAGAAWPILPILDQALLQQLQATPPDWLNNRTSQDALLRRHFPELARLPLDRNADDVSPLAPTLSYRIRAAVARRLAPVRPTGGERRYYARMYDFDNPGWQSIRAAAEPGRAAMEEWFDREALATWLPPAGQLASHTDPVAEGFAPKLLTGFMRWLAMQGASPA